MSSHLASLIAIALRAKIHLVVTTTNQHTFLDFFDHTTQARYDGARGFSSTYFLALLLLLLFPWGELLFSLFFSPGTNPHHRYYSFGCGEGCFLCFTLKFPSTSHRCSAQLSSRIRLASWAFSSTQNRNTLRRCQGIWPGEKKPSPSHTQTPEDGKKTHAIFTPHAAERRWNSVVVECVTAVCGGSSSTDDDSTRGHGAGGTGQKTQRQNRRPSRTIITNNKNRAHGHGFFLLCEFSFFLQLFPSSS